MMKGVEVIAEILQREGVEYLMGYPRTPLIEVAAKLGIRPVLARQERVGISMADGYSRISNGRKFGVIVSQHGPGTENAFPGIAQAYAENIPVLMLPGGEALDRQHTRPMFSAIDNYRHVTKYLAQANVVTRIPALMRRAFHNLRTGKPGPVLIEVPRDIWEAEFPGEFQYEPVRPLRSAPDPADVSRAAEALVAAKALVILAGAGVKNAEASGRLVRLAELLQAPVMTTNPGKSAFPENHPLSLGAALGRSMSEPAYRSLHDADCVFAIGSSLTLTSFGPSVPAGKSIVHATNDAGDINKDYAVAHGLLGDAALTLDALIAEVEDRLGDEVRADRAASIRAAKQAWLETWMGQLTSDEVPINPYRVIWDMMGAVDRDNTIVTHDSGSPREQFLPFWEATTPGSYMGWGKSTQLGHGLGLIMGAKLAAPDKLCINVMGDAAIGMVGMDIETAARNKLGTITVVFNNGVMAAERDSMPYAHEKFGALDQFGNYAEVARSLGAEGFRVEQPDGFLPALKDAIAATEQNRPVLIECITKEGYDFSRYD
jgi:acetolactate synthase-1/2/3 large subunit